MNKKSGFTLAEVMIVFVVIGVLSAILIPTIFNSAPNQSKLRAKKSYSTLVRAVETLINSAYDSNPPESALQATPFVATSVTSYADIRRRYFCNQLAQVLNVSDVNCSATGITGTLTTANYANAACGDNYTFCLKTKTTSGVTYADYATLQSNIDTACVNAFKSTVTAPRHHFKTNDGVFWFIAGNDFSNTYSITVDSIKQASGYALVCMCTSGKNDPSNCGNDAYGAGVRKDGKIVVGAKLQTVLNNVTNDD